MTAASKIEKERRIKNEKREEFLDTEPEEFEQMTPTPMIPSRQRHRQRRTLPSDEHLSPLSVSPDQYREDVADAADSLGIDG